MCNTDNLINKFYLYTKNSFKNIKKRRLLLPLLFILFIFFDESVLYNTAAFLFIVFFCCMIIFFNFPILVTWSNTKPLYYDDLYLDSDKLPSLLLPDYKKKSYKKLYKLFLTVYDSIMISLISNYWLVKTNGTYSFYEIVGITGGILQIFHVLNLFTGTIILYAIKHYITSDSKIIPILNRLPSDDNIDTINILDNNICNELDEEIENKSKDKPINEN